MTDEHIDIVDNDDSSQEDGKWSSNFKKVISERNSARSKAEALEIENAEKEAELETLRAEKQERVDAQNADAQKAEARQAYIDEHGDTLIDDVDDLVASGVDIAKAHEIAVKNVEKYGSWAVLPWGDKKGKAWTITLDELAKLEWSAYSDAVAKIKNWELKEV